MKVTAAVEVGEVVCPVSKSITVSGNKLRLPEGVSITHGEAFNATLIGNFLVATRAIAADEEVVLNFNLAFYDMVKDDTGCFDQPCVQGFRYLSDVDKQLLYVYADESVREAAIAEGFIPNGREGEIDVVRAKRNELVAVCKGDHEAGAVVFESTGVMLPFPVRSTVELPGDTHLRLTGGSEFILHSCKPNLKLEIVGDLLRGVALRSIEQGERLTFNYLCTEWSIAKPFKCHCNVYCCYGVIKGFEYLDREQQEHLLPQCSSAVRDKYARAQRTDVAMPSSYATNALAFTPDSCVVVQSHMDAGTVLYSVTASPAAAATGDSSSAALRVRGGVLHLEHLRLPHSCDANTALFEGRLVAARPLVPGDTLTINTNALAYALEEPFDCSCGSVHCCRSASGFGGLSTAEKDRCLIYAPGSVREAAIAAGYVVPSTSPWVEVRGSASMGQATYARTFVPAGTRVFRVKGLVLPFPTVYTIYIGEGKHLTFAGGAQCLAHSCTPNTRIVVDAANGALDCFSTADIAAGELVSFNYLCTEWSMDAPFQCACGSGAACFGTIQGYAHLSHNQQMRLWPHATKAVQTLFAHTRRTANSVLSSLDRALVEPAARPAGGGAEVRVTRDLSSGTALFDAPAPVEMVSGGVRVGDIFLPHSCDPTAAILEEHVVLCQAVAEGAVVSVNVNQLAYTLEEPFDCQCGTSACVGRVAGFKHLSTAEKDAALLCTVEEVRAAAIRHDGYRNQCSCPSVEVRANGDMGQATFARKAVRRGERLLHVTGLVLPFPTVYTIQLDKHRHLLFGDGAQCLAHSCDPNTRIMIDAERGALHCLALRDIAEGELISFNYLTTEWDMNSPFKCLCGADKSGARCFGTIRGFAHLDDWSRQQLWSLTTPVIRELAARNENWRRLSAHPLRADAATGLVCASREVSEGTPLLTAEKVQVNASGAVGASLVVDGITLRHSAAANAALIQYQVVLIETVCAGTEITVDLNSLVYDAAAAPLEGRVPTPHPVTGFKHLAPAEQARLLIYTDDAVRAAALRDGMEVPCSCPLVKVRDNGAMGQATFAAAPIRSGTRFLRVPGLCLPFPTLYTIMLTNHRHLLFSDGAQCLAHSCDPNVQIVVDAVNNQLECEALRDIADGELISFDYNTTEWDMRAPFQCVCGSERCVYTVQGFRHLTQRQREAIQAHTTVAVRELAGMHNDVPLPATLRANEQRYLEAAAALAPETVLLELFHYDVQPHQIAFGRDYAIAHSSCANCVLVEGRVLTLRALARGEALTVNMNYFVYDMRALFPRAFFADCQGFRHLDDDVKQRELYLCEPPVRAQAMRDGWLVRSSQKLLTIRPNGGMGQTAYASADIPVGTRLFHCTGVVVPFPTMYTICVGRNRHLLFGDAAECIAHHCDPNVAVVLNNDDCTFDFVTIKPIAAGDMVTFNYNTTEWDMNSPFVCLCGSARCAGKIHGFKHLTAEQRRQLWSITSDVVKADVAAETASA